MVLRGQQCCLEQVGLIVVFLCRLIKYCAGDDWFVGAVLNPEFQYGGGFSCIERQTLAIEPRRFVALQLVQTGGNRRKPPDEVPPVVLPETTPLEVRWFASVSKRPVSP